MAEEKELTVEEMKSLVSVATLLPALLDKIAAISKEVDELKASFTDIKSKYNASTNAVISYKEAVDNLTKNQPDIKAAIKPDLDAIKQTLARIEWRMGMDGQPVEIHQIPDNKPSPSSSSKKEKPKDEEKDKVKEIVNRILEDRGGRKSRTLTLVDVKTWFRVDEEVASKVLKWFEDNKMYNPKLCLLTFPKRKK